MSEADVGFLVDDWAEAPVLPTPARVIDVNAFKKQMAHDVYFAQD
jgi:hypothetical protein